MNFKLYRIILFILIYIIATVSIFAISYEVTLARAEPTHEPARTFEEIDGTRDARDTIDTREIEDLPQMQPSEHEYLLKDSNGKIAVYKANEYDPYIILDVYTNTLPYVDRQNLLEGITILGDDNLRSIIEDFDS